MIKPIRFSALHIALCYAAVSFLVLALFAMPLWYAWSTTIDQDRKEQIQGEVGKLSQLFLKQGAAAMAEAIQFRVGDEPDKSRQIFFLADPSFNKLAGNLSSWPATLSSQGGMHTLSIAVREHPIEVILYHQILPGGYHLLVGRDIARFEYLENLFLYGLFGSGATVLLVAILGGLLIRRILLLRVHAINQTTSAIVEGDLSRRLPVLHEGDELEMLAQTVNRMLDQIETLVNSVKHASNAIAHDLRTPLTELRSRLEEIALTKPSIEYTLIEIDEAIGDVDQLINIFNALLRLAEVDSGTRRAGFVPVEITKLAGEITEFYQPIAELKQISLSFIPTEYYQVSGDPILLAQAIGNLIDNALKYVQSQGAVVVDVRRHSGRLLEVIVSDNGPGISEVEKPKVTERFYRIDASRATPGVGLGLSLVESVARLHGGSLELKDNRPGLSCILLLSSS